MKNIKKLFFTMILGTLCTGFSAHSAPYPGCDCASVIACETAACITSLGIACWFQSGRIDSICVCKIGAMAHCTNWDSDLVNCTADTREGCPTRAELKKKYGKNYDKIIQVTTDALMERKSKQQKPEESPEAPSTKPQKPETSPAIPSTK